MNYKNIGDKNTVAFEYALENEPQNEKNNFWGSIRLWIHGINVCKYQCENQTFEHEGDLSYIVEWLCENLEYIIGYDNYPLPVEGNNMNDIWEKVYKFEADELEEELWFGANSRWIFRHTWLNTRAGAVFPSVCFRRLENDVEISWNNEFYKKYNIYYLSEKAGFRVNRIEFIRIVVMFLKSIISDFNERNTGLTDWIKNLQKKLQLYEMA